MHGSIKTLFEISRPGLWLVFVWLYVWPTGGSYWLLHSPKFWAGLLYCTFPLNLLVYGMNDMVDEDVDEKNPRKGNWVYGAKTTKAQREYLPIYIGIVNFTSLFILALITDDWFYIAVWTWCAIMINISYNNEPFQLSRNCPWEVPCMIVGHFLIPLLACHINGVPLPSLSSWIFNGLLLARSHIWLEYADIDVDRTRSKRTIAVALGKVGTLRLVILITLSESLVGFVLLSSAILGIFSLLGAVVFYTSAKQGNESKVHASVAQSAVGVFLMCYLWVSKTLV